MTSLKVQKETTGEVEEGCVISQNKVKKGFKNDRVINWIFLRWSRLWTIRQNFRFDHT